MKWYFKLISDIYYDLKTYILGISVGWAEWKVTEWVLHNIFCLTKKSAAFGSVFPCPERSKEDRLPLLTRKVVLTKGWVPNDLFRCLDIISRCSQFHFFDPKGQICEQKRMNFLKNSEGGGGVISNQNIYIAKFGPLNRAFFSIKLTKRGLVVVKLNFFENSSILVCESLWEAIAKKTNRILWNNFIKRWTPPPPYWF